MPLEGYPKDRVATTKYEKGQVKDYGKYKDIAGTDAPKPQRAGNVKDTGEAVEKPKRAGKQDKEY